MPCGKISVPENIFKAIEYSIETEDCLLNNKLKEKSAESADYSNQSAASAVTAPCIRVPFGVNFGNEPSQRIVLEIWPKEDFSTRQLNYDYQFEELKNMVLEEYELKSAVLLNVIQTKLNPILFLAKKIFLKNCSFFKRENTN